MTTSHILLHVAPNFIADFKALYRFATLPQPKSRSQIFVLSKGLSLLLFKGPLHHLLMFLLRIVCTDLPIFLFSLASVSSIDFGGRPSIG